MCFLYDYRSIHNFHDNNTIRASRNPLQRLARVLHNIIIMISRVLTVYTHWEALDAIASIFGRRDDSVSTTRKSVPLIDFFVGAHRKTTHKRGVYTARERESSTNMIFFSHT